MKTMRLTRLIALLGLAMAPVACVHSDGSQRPVDVDFVLGTAQHLEGKTIEVRGYLRFRDDEQNLWSSVEAYAAVSGHFVPLGSDLWNHCISLFNTGSTRASLLRYSGRTVQVVGSLVRRRRGRDDIAFETCNELGVSVISVTVFK